MTAIGGRLGLTVDLAKVPVSVSGGSRPIRLPPGRPGPFQRILRAIPGDRAQRQRLNEFESIFEGLPYGLVGEVTENPELVITGKSGKEILRENIFFFANHGWGIWVKTRLRSRPGRGFFDDKRTPPLEHYRAAHSDGDKPLTALPPGSFGRG